MPGRWRRPQLLQAGRLDHVDLQQVAEETEDMGENDRTDEPQP
jgi:hypothetical protein